jgi:hypothetical protein
MEGKPTQQNKPENDIRVSFNSRVRNIITYCTALLKENKFRTINLSAIGGAIGKLVDAVEVIKVIHAGLWQTNKLGTVSYQTVDNKGDVQNQRLYPKLEVVLSLDEPKDKSEGSQGKLDDETRGALLKIHDEIAEKRRAERPEGERQEGERQEGERPRGRGGFRGSRGGFRGSRGGFKGSRGGFNGGSRGGFRGSRGGFNGGSRGGFRGSRGGFNGESRGGFRGSRGGFRGSRGGFNNRGRGSY